MTDDSQLYRLSRRKVLAGLGGVGLASAGAGLGTSAYFNDTESFTNNTITAGTLDLKVDWQQMYYGASESWEFVNAHPDHDGDGEQSIDTGDGVVSYSDEGRNIVDHLTCANLDHEFDFNGQDSLVALEDVKPGDQGEITFSLHLCSNPGYVWLTADNFTEGSGVTTEPEAAQLADGEQDDGELAENTFVEFWYDENCDNGLDRDGGEESNPLCVELVLDASGSMAGEKNDNTRQGAKDLAESILNANSSSKVGVTFFSADGYDESAQNQLSVTDSDASNLSAVQSTIDTLPENGDDTAIGAGITTATADLANCPDGHDRVMIVLSNGGENVESDSQVVQHARDAEDNQNIRVITIGIGSANTGLLDDVATDPPSENAYTGTDPEDIESVFTSISEVVLAGETVILGEGDGVHDDPVTLAEAMEIMENNDGRIPLDGNGDMEYGDGATAEARDCFEPYTGHCIGARWWVPTDVGNEIQGDTVSFDLGFYAEQCRNNDGSGTEEVPS